MLPNSVKQIWYADDATAIGSLHHLRNWWDTLVKIAPKFGYFVNPYKSWIVTKDHNLEKAADLFRCSNVNITSKGRPYLGVPIGTQVYTSQFIESKVTPLDFRNRATINYCPLSTSCCLCSLYTWPVKSMALPPSYDTKYVLLFRTPRNGNTNTAYSSNH